METRRSSLARALEHPAVQLPLAAALLVPVVATAGQFATTGFWTRSSTVDLLFWPGLEWKWAVTMPVWLTMGAMLTAYVAGIAWLLRRRTLSQVVLLALGAIVAAKLVAAGVNRLTGWHELQNISKMDLAGKANRAVFAHWHNPAWEELVFRGIPLIALLLVVRKAGDRTSKAATWCYVAIPAIACAAYHVPGHGPARIVDTLILSAVFSAMTLRFSFFAPLVMHDVFDAVVTISLAKIPSIPRAEVAWLADHAHVLNTTWTLALLAWLGAIGVAFVARRLRAGKASPAPLAPRRAPASTG